MYLKYLKPHEEEFIKEFGDQIDTSSYKDWVNKEKKLNDIYLNILNGGRTFKQIDLNYEGFISPCTTDYKRYQFTMFDQHLQPIGHFTNSRIDDLARDILDKGYEINYKCNILN